jgi:4'-phosphopantetheinyl transferase
MSKSWNFYRHRDASNGWIQHGPLLMLNDRSDQPLIRLAASDIHLWLTDYEQITDARLHGSYRQILSDDERQQEPRFHFAKDRRRYLVTRALLRTVLSRYAAIPPASWTFSTNAYGRPEIANVDVAAEQLCFNISHTHSLIVLGITHDRALGVDVENVKTRQAALESAGRFFAPTEVAALAELEYGARHYRFFEYWTFKESYVKARGMGLSLSLEKFAFRFPHETKVALDIDSELADEPARWHLAQLEPAADYLVAVCAERGSQSPKLSTRWMIPMREEQMLATKLLRTS